MSAPARRLVPAILLILLLLVTLFTGCAGSRSTEEETPERLLVKGYYALYDKDDALAGYLNVGRSTLTWYDRFGNEEGEYDLTFYAKKDIYRLDDEDAFTVREKNSELILTTVDKEKYYLESIRKAEIPVPTAEEPTETETEPPTETEAPPETTEPTTTAPTTTAVPTTAPPSTSAVLSAQDIYELALPSTVNITAIVNESYYYTGTGFFYDENGTVITNYHVIEGTVSGYITTYDGLEFDITEVIGYDEDLDIAILATARRSSIPLVRRSSAVRTGETVYALGSSLGLSGTFSDGIISTASRGDSSGHSYIQHTAAISHGNSGGPLLDNTGAVIGINVAYLEGGQNLNLAIPIAKVEDVPRSTHLSLRALYNQLNGTASEAPANTDDWHHIYVASGGGCTLSVKMPDFLYKAIIVNEKETGLQAQGGENTYFIFLGADCTEGDFSGYSLEGELLDGFTDMLTKTLTNFEDVLFDPIESQGVTINETDWTMFFTSGTAEDAFLQVIFLVHLEDSCTTYFTLVSALADSSSAEEDEAARRQILSQILSSATFTTP